MTATISIELAWWAACLAVGTAPYPYLLTHLGLAAGGLIAAVAIQRVFWPSSPRPHWATLVGGTALLAIGASLFLPLKYAIPREIPFWLDQPLASSERLLFGADPWMLIDRVLGWATVPIDCVYGLWLPVLLGVFFAVLVSPPSTAKTRALIAFSCAWFALGVLAATLLSSAGPIFYDRLFGGGRFALLNDTLLRRGASFAIAESDAMWRSYADGRPGLVAGMSAAPSLHVGMSFWIYLAARTLARPLATAALAYAIFVWFASVQLGWHYVTDGLLAVVGMLMIWGVAGKMPGARSAAGFQSRSSEPTKTAAAH